MQFGPATPWHSLQRGQVVYVVEFNIFQAIFPQSLDLYKIKILQKKIREIITLSYSNVSYCIVSYSTVLYIKS